MCEGVFSAKMLLCVSPQPTTVTTRIAEKKVVYHDDKMTFVVDLWLPPLADQSGINSNADFCPSKYWFKKKKKRERRNRTGDKCLSACFCYFFLSQKPNLREPFHGNLQPPPTACRRWRSEHSPYKHMVLAFSIFPPEKYYCDNRN